MNFAFRHGRDLPKRILHRLLRVIGRRLPLTSHRWGPPRGLCLNTAEWCRTHTKTEFILLAPEEDASIPPPLAFEDLVEQYQRLLKRKTPERFVCVIPGGRVCHRGIVLTPDDYILADTSYAVLSARKNKERPPILDVIKLPSLRKECGTIAVISGPWAENYYHWMFDVLPRLHLLQESGIKIDKYIVNHNKSFQQQSLALLGITPQMCIADTPDLHLQAERLVVPSLPGGQGNPPRWACDFLRDALLNPLLKTHENAPQLTPNNKNPTKLYISRADAPGRRVTNEADVLRILEPKGFCSITLDGLSLREQTLLFHGAEAIVAPHGAALTNLVFCRPHTPVVEFFAPGWAYPVYNFVAANSDLRLGCLIGEGERPLPPNNGQYCQQDIAVNIAELEAMLKKMEI